MSNVNIMTSNLLCGLKDLLTSCVLASDLVINNEIECARELYKDKIRLYFSFQAYPKVI